MLRTIHIRLPWRPSSLWACGFCAVLLANTAVHGQSSAITGRVLDGTDGSGLPNAPVLLVDGTDTTRQRNALADSTGRYEFRGLPKGTYMLRAAFTGFQAAEQTVQLNTGPVRVEFRLQPSITMLQAVEKVAIRPRAEQQGDTIIFNAAAYKVNPDATAEDLVTKMPGIVGGKGNITAQGEKVLKVLLDGEEFFGSDALTVLRNLPAEIVDKVQVFDKRSEQAEFTGFDDGDTEKTINIVTKKGMNEGHFGTVDAGYGTNDRYTANLAMNWFKGTRRLSLLGLVNNVNRQDFSSGELSGLPSGGRSGFYTTQAGGLNYNNTLGRTKLASSYFFNAQLGESESMGERTTFLNDSSLQVASDHNLRTTTNTGHRITLRTKTDFNGANSLIVNPRISFQQNGLDQWRTAAVEDGDGHALSSTSNVNNRRGNNFSLSNTIVFRHRFALKGRTLSASLTTAVSQQEAHGRLHAENQFGSEGPVPVDQRNTADDRSQDHGLQVRYTEPIGPRGMLQVSVAPSIRSGDAAKLTYDEAGGNGELLLNGPLSNMATNTVQALGGGLGYRYRGEGFMFNVGVDGRMTNMRSEQTYPRTFMVQRSYADLLPNARFTRNWGKLTRLQLIYRSQATVPTINQLQSVVDNSDPLRLSTGNLLLGQSYGHSLTARFNTLDSTRTRPFFALLSAQAQPGRVGRVTYAPATDSTLADGTVLPKGAQLTLPENLDGYYALRGTLSYGLPMTALKSNLNLDAGASVEHLPGAVNGVRSSTWNINRSLGALLASNSSSGPDFRAGYTAMFNTASSTGGKAGRESAYYQGQLTAQLIASGWKRWVLDNRLDYRHYSGLGAAYDKDALVWNAALGRKFLANDALELRVTAYDILGRNAGVSHEVTENMVSSTATNMLQRYFLVTLRYNVRAYKGLADGPIPAGD